MFNSRAFYPSWWDNTITIYNRYIDPATKQISWFREVLKNCLYRSTAGEATIGSVTLKTTDILISIPQNERFKAYADWNVLTSEDKAKFFTVRPKDIIINGMVTDEINEYVTGQRASDVLNKYRDTVGAAEITSWDNNCNTGIGSPHYFIKGK